MPKLAGTQGPACPRPSPGSWPSSRARARQTFGPGGSRPIGGSLAFLAAIGRLVGSSCLSLVAAGEDWRAVPNAATEPKV